MKPPPFEYHRPADLPEAVRLLATLDNAKVLAGGQSLMAMLNLRYLLPDALVDINRIPGLAGVAVGPEAVRIGAMTRQSALERDAEAAAAMPILRDALRHVGHRQTRNRGTVGGSLCHLDPAAELPLLALLHDAVVEVAGDGGAMRRVPVAEFVAGFMMPAIEPHEIVAAVELPRWSAAHGWGFHEFSRRHGDFAIASAACLVERAADGTIGRIALGVGGVGSVPQRVPGAEAALVGTAGGPDALAAASAAMAELEVIGDFHGAAEYRLGVARAMLRRSVALALSRAGPR
jgi:aerobic carbon-monoxide dehydrogenase medium subunit